VEILKILIQGSCQDRLGKLLLTFLIVSLRRVLPKRTKKEEREKILLENGKNSSEIRIEPPD